MSPINAAGLNRPKVVDGRNRWDVDLGTWHDFLAPWIERTGIIERPEIGPVAIRVREVS